MLLDNKKEEKEMIRLKSIRLGLQGIQSLFATRKDADSKPVRNVVLAKWEDHYDRYPCYASRLRRNSNLRYLTPAD